MNLSIKLFFAFSLIAATIACNHENNAEHHTSLQSIDSAKNSSHEPKPESELQLNNGKKWKLDDTTRKNIENITHVFSKLKSKAPISSNEFNNAGYKIQKATDQLINGCRMEGADHEALHKWLLPFLSTVESLSNERDSIIAKETFDNIDSQIKMVGNYFE